MMKVSFFFLLFSLHLPQRASAARSWTVIDPFHPLAPVDNGPLEELIYENDPFFFTMSPTNAPPSEAPSTSEPTETPSMQPTITAVPTSRPTRRPSGPPTPAPTEEPSTQPSPPPTTPPPVVVPYYPPVPPPNNPDEGYFNYDYRSVSKYGPGTPQLVYLNNTTFQIQFGNNGWARVSPQHYNYWKEFGLNGYGPWNGVLTNHSVETNMCGNSGRQSPIDIRETPNSKCYETHQVRSRSGDLHLSDDEEIKKLIERNKLRLLYQRRPCRGCREPDPPLADFPHNWPGLIDLLHIDFKVPSEHTIYGERFDGEMQLMYIHPKRRRSPSVAVPMKATKDGYNPELQRALDEFQQQYKNDYDACVGGTLNRARRMGEITEEEAAAILSIASEVELRGAERMLQTKESTETTTTTTESWEREGTIILPDTTTTTTEATTKAATTTAKKVERNEPTVGPGSNATISRKNWDPHHPLMIPSVHFFGYEGSVTEPPCGEFVSWFVMDGPMLMSFEQLDQIKRLIFTHLSPQCRRTSVHYKESVARPVQDRGNRTVWRCTSEDWAPDPR